MNLWKKLGVSLMLILIIGLGFQDVSKDPDRTSVVWQHFILAIFSLPFFLLFLFNNKKIEKMQQHAEKKEKIIWSCRDPRDKRS